MGICNKGLTECQECWRCTFNYWTGSFIYRMISDDYKMYSSKHPADFLSNIAFMIVYLLS